LYRHPPRGDEEEDGNNKPDGELNVNRTARATARATGGQARTSQQCRCGGRDHQRTSSTKCPWHNLSKSVVAEEEDGNNKPDGELIVKRASNNTARATGGQERTSHECKCGGRDHQRTTSTKCPWHNLSKSVVAGNYEERRRKKINKMRELCTSPAAGEQTTEMRANATTSTASSCQNLTGGKVHSTSDLVGGKNELVGAKNRNVQSTGKLVGAKNRSACTTCEHM
jgi:hypothetical protein